MEEVKKNLLTYEGLKKLQDELEELKTVKRQEIAQRIKEAREQGDLSENAEYDAARDEQREIEGRIEELEKTLKNAEVIDGDENTDSKRINIGCKVTVLDIEYNETEEYKIVGSTESDIFQGLISNESPLGVALIGHKKNDVISVETPGGTVKYKVVKFEKAN